MIGDALTAIFGLVVLVAMIVASIAFVVAFFPWFIGAVVVFYGGGAIIDWVSRHDRAKS